VFGQPHDIQQARDDAALVPTPLDRQPIGDVCPYRFPRKQPEMLEDHSDARSGAGDGGTVEEDMTAPERQQTGDSSEQRGLATPRRPDDAE